MMLSDSTSGKGYTTTKSRAVENRKQQQAYEKGKATTGESLYFAAIRLICLHQTSSPTSDRTFKARCMSSRVWAADQ